MVPDGVNGVRMFNATVLSAKPRLKPSILVLAITDRKTPEITLRVKSTKARIEILNPIIANGAEIWFQGTPVLFSRDPFMVTFEVQVEDIKFERP